MKTISVSGSWRECGRLVGEATREDIRAVAEQLLPNRIKASGLDRDGMIAIARQYLQAGESEISGLTEYLEGLADGAGLGLDDILLTAAEEELGAWNVERCSSLATLTRDHGVVLAHNEDYDPWYLGRMSLLDLKIDGHPRVFCLGYPGQLPCVGPSLNDCGVAVTNNSLTFRSRLGAWARARQLRAGLSTSLAEAVRVLKGGNEGLANHFFACDAERIHSLEVAPPGVANATLSEVSGIMLGASWSHVNHLRNLKAIETERPSESSRLRGAALMPLEVRGDFQPEELLAVFSEPPVLKRSELTLATVVIQPKIGSFWCQGWGPHDNQLLKLQF